MNFKFIKVPILFLFIFVLKSISYAQVSIKPGEISYIEVKYDNLLIAGETYNISLKFTDAFGNPSNNYGLASKIKIVSNGVEVSKSKIYPADIKNGEVSITVKGKKAGFYNLAFFLDEKPLILKILPLEALTSTMSFRVINNKVETAVIESKDTYLPGYPFEVRISFFDKEGNPVIEKSHVNQTLIINANGVAKEVNLNDFNGNMYKFEISPFVVEDFNISIQDKFNKKVLASKIVKPEIQTIGKIDIVAPSETEAGKPFKLEIKVYDTQNRLIKVYDKIGKDIKLKVNGSGRIIPDIIPKEAFVEGIAQIQAIYTKSETVNIVPVILGLDSNISVEKKTQEDRKVVEQTKEEKVIKDKVEKKTTTVKLRFPLELGKINKANLISSKENDYIYKIYFSKRNLDLEVKNFKKDIFIEKEKIGKLEISQDKDLNIILKVSLKENYTSEIFLLKNPENTVELKVIERW